MPGRCPHQFRKERALFLCLMVVVSEVAQETQKSLDVVGRDGLAVFNTRSHVVQNLEGPQDNLVFLNQEIRAFHESLLPRFLNASASPRSLQNSSAAPASAVWCARKLAWIASYSSR